MLLTAHFTLEEMVASEYATRHGIDNTPDEDEVEELHLLCEQVLEPERYLFGGVPIFVTSGFRSKMVNCGVGSSRTSQHPKGQAADHHVFTFSDEDVVRRLANSPVPFDQLILEFPPHGWVHVSRADKPRRQILVARQSPAGAVYAPWQRDRVSVPQV